ncbi:MAG TPA: DUF1178 family protein [Terriglobia bacterium]|nr:DUF1178 family protein [Terriglobia bacterium]
MMILYQLKCQKEHQFETWFKDGQTCDKQLARKSVECPVCGNKSISKALMAPRIGGGEKARADEQKQMAIAAAEVKRQLQEIRAKVEDNCDYVGDRFADEARKIHYGETEARGIYGEASDDDFQELNDEGIEVARIPWLPRSDA